jgi:hypothetical protein
MNGRMFPMNANGRYAAPAWETHFGRLTSQLCTYKGSGLQPIVHKATQVAATLKR